MSGPGGEACVDCYWFQDAIQETQDSFKKWDDKPEENYPLGHCHLYPEPKFRHADHWCSIFKPRIKCDTTPTQGGGCSVLQQVLEALRKISNGAARCDQTIVREGPRSYIPDKPGQGIIGDTDES